MRNFAALSDQRRQTLPELRHGPPKPDIARLLAARASPPIDSDALVRPRLLNRLDLLRHRLTLVCAPEGSGKTVLLGQWAAALSSMPEPPRVAALTLGPEAHDPRLLAYALAGALGAGVPSARSLVTLDDGGNRSEALIVELAISCCDEPTVLLLDGGERLGDEGEALLASLIEGAPPNLHLVLATRSEPALPLPRLRLQGALLELGGEELRWTAEEAGALLNGVLRLGLSSADVSLLVGRVEGWVTGLRLAGLALRAGGRADEFSGADRLVLDYVASEILAPQPPAVQAFLLRTAALAELSTPLCAEVPRVGSVSEGQALQEARKLLDYLERHNLFVIPLDRSRTRYRYHALVAEALRA